MEPMTVNSRCLSKRFMSWRTRRAWCGPSHWETALYGCRDSMIALAALPTLSVVWLQRLDDCAGSITDSLYFSVEQGRFVGSRRPRCEDWKLDSVGVSG